MTVLYVSDELHILTEIWQEIEVKQKNDNRDK